MREKVIALGFFDGVHLGHGALLRRTVELAREKGCLSAVFTFDRPPKEVVTGIPVPLINSPEDRKELMHRLYGIDRVILAPFDQAMMTCPWDRFLTEILLKQQHAVHLVAGHDYRFGYRNEGTTGLLLEKCRELGLGCDIIPRVEKGGITVSSTYIRRLVELGQLERAADFLGHPHTLSQTVRHGQQLGHRIGVPTINFAVPAHVLVPSRGVYITRAYLPDGEEYAGVTNVGIRPTVNECGGVTVETYLLGYEGDLYGKTVRLEFFRRLRDEIRFDSLEALRTQIASDAEAAREYFAAAQKKRSPEKIPENGISR